MQFIQGLHYTFFSQQAIGPQSVMIIQLRTNLTNISILSCLTLMG